MITDEQQKAIAAAELAVKDNPGDFELHIELGMAYFDTERYDEAMAAFQRALVLDPEAARAYNGMGRVYYHTGPAQAAIEAYEHAIALDRNYIDAYYGLGILYSAQLGDYQPALEAFELGLEHNPNEAFLVASIGSTYARMGRFEEALVSLQQAIRLDPDNTFAYSWLSILYLHLKRDDDAMRACQHEIEIADTHSARRVLGYVYDGLGNYEEAITQLQGAVTLEPEDYEARGALARVYRTVGRHDDSLEQFSLGSQLAKQDNDYGQACFEVVSGHVEQALTLLEVALRKGQVQPGWVRIDPEFALMTDDLRFKVLIGDE